MRRATDHSSAADELGDLDFSINLNTSDSITTDQTLEGL